LRAGLRDRHSAVALVAEQNILGEVVGKGNLATPAAEDKATITALNKGSPSPPIKK